MFLCALSFARRQIAGIIENWSGTIRHSLDDAGLGPSGPMPVASFLVHARGINPKSTTFHELFGLTLWALVQRLRELK